MKPPVYLACIALAVLSLIPYAADVFDLDLPILLRFALMPLSEGMHYMAVLFHEPGHALCHWLFGEPALPMIDTVHGGGTTYALGRSNALLAGIYVLMIAGAGLLLRARKFRFATALTIFIALHAVLVRSGLDLAVTLVMGHGTEIITGAVFISLALARSDILKTLPERVIALAAGLNFWGRNALLCAGLVMNGDARRSYATQKGISGLADYAQAGKILGVSAQAVAAGMAMFLIVWIGLAAVYIRRRQRRADTT